MSDKWEMPSGLAQQITIGGWRKANARAVAAETARDAAVARAEAAEQAVQRVRELHQKRAFTKYEYCVECDVDERAAPWPCDTIRALDGPADTAAEGRR